jgi:hypothetical protein
MTKKNSEVIVFGNEFAYLKVANAAIIRTTDSVSDLTPATASKTQTASDKKPYEMMPWGEDNLMPQDIISKVGVMPIMASNILFKVQMGYGQGITPVKIKNIEYSNGEFNVDYELYDNAEVTDFFENNDTKGYLLEQLQDLNYFYNNFVEIILNREAPASRKVVEIRHKEAAFSRWTKMNDKGIIEKCLYCADWANVKPENVAVTDVLDFKNPTLDLLRRIGRVPDSKDEKVYRYIIPVQFPTPGKSYYAEPYWYALIRSGWYDFALQIPEFKKAILTNQMTIKYMVYIADDYFNAIFQQEGINEPQKQKDRVKLEYTNIQKFLSGVKNSGKATIGKIKYTIDGKEQKNIIIQALENNFKGGEYIEDSEEVTNIINYGMGVHSSIVGSLGKNKTVSGTEARELFIIKQALEKPIRDLLLKPFYLIKKINNWPADLHFIIPNITITTLDKSPSGTTNQIKA